MKKTMLLAGVLTFALVVPLATAADPMTQKLSQLQGNEFSKEYAKHAIKHHQQGIEMAKLVEHHSQNQKLVQLAQKMVQSQQQEIQELEQLKSHHADASSNSTHSPRSTSVSRTVGSSSKQSAATSGHPSSGTSSDHQNGHGSNHDASGHAEMEKMHRETMSRLESAQGQEFDRLFVEEMSQHHKMAIEMNDLAESRADGDLASFARKSAQQQQQELQQLQRLNSGKQP